MKFFICFLRHCFWSVLFFWISLYNSKWPIFVFLVQRKHWREQNWAGHEGRVVAAVRGADRTAFGCWLAVIAWGWGGSGSGRLILKAAARPTLCMCAGMAAPVRAADEKQMLSDRHHHLSCKCLNKTGWRASPGVSLTALGGKKAQTQTQPLPLTSTLCCMDQTKQPSEVCVTSTRYSLELCKQICTKEKRILSFRY